MPSISEWVTALRTKMRSHVHANDDTSQVDHGTLAGLADDDHPQYLLRAEVNVDAIADELAHIRKRLAALDGDLSVDNGDIRRDNAVLNHERTS